MACDAVAVFQHIRTGLRGGPVRLFCLGLLAAQLLVGASAGAEMVSGEILGSGCTGCHGSFGVSSGSAIPTIAGIDRRYLMRVMLEFKNGERPASIMDRIAQGYSDHELRRVSVYFSKLPWQGEKTAQDASQMTEAEALHDRGCEECHERQGRYQDRDVSRIAGQGAEYLFIQLKMYQAQPQNSRQPEKMKQALEALTDGQMIALARFYSGQR